MMFTKTLKLMMLISILLCFAGWTAPVPLPTPKAPEDTSSRWAKNLRDDCDTPTPTPSETPTAPPTHPADTPDDNVQAGSHGNSITPPPGGIPSSDIVGIFESNHESLQNLLNCNYISSGYIVSEFSPEQVREATRVIVIPSAALMGAWQNESLRELLDVFVRDLGGTIICFSQQYGYQYGILPVPTIEDRLSAFGFREAQSCYNNSSVCISQSGNDPSNQILASASSDVFDANIDGFFIDYPEDSTILLSQWNHGSNARYPVLISYPCGQGRIIASTLYSDWAFSTYQSSIEEMRLIRDIIAWSLDSRELLETSLENPGAPCSFFRNLEIENLSDTTAFSAKIKLLSPGRLPISETIVELSEVLYPGQSRELEWEGMTGTESGVYWFDIELLDSFSAPIEGTTQHLRHIVNSGNICPSYTPAVPGVYFSSMDESVPIGGDAVFKITTGNVPDRENYGLGYQLTVYGNPTPYVSEVAYQSSPSFCSAYYEPLPFEDQIIRVPDVRWNLRAWISIIVYHYGYNNGVNQPIFTPAPPPPTPCWHRHYEVGLNKGVSVYQPKVDVELSASSEEYSPGDTVKLSASIRNLSTGMINVHPQIWIADNDNQLIYGPIDYEKSIAPGIVLSDDFYFDTGSICLESPCSGPYFAHVQVYRDGEYESIGGADAIFNILSRTYRLIHVIPESGYHAGSNEMLVRIETGSGSGSFAPQSKYYLTLTRPDNTIQTLSGPIGEQPFPINLSIPGIQFGDPLLQGAFQMRIEAGVDEDQNLYGAALYLIPNEPFICGLFDKTSYRVRDPIVLRLKMSNPGYFAGVYHIEVSGEEMQSIPIEIEMPAFQADPMQRLVPWQIGDAESPGIHEVQVSRSSILQPELISTYYYFVPDSSIRLSLPAAEAEAGGALPILADNIGGVDTGCSYTAEMQSAFGQRIKREDGSLPNEIEAGGSETLEFGVPDQTVAGSHLVMVSVTDSGNGNRSSLRRSVDIDGLGATLESTFSEPFYRTEENVNAGVSAINEGPAILQASVNYWVSQATDAQISAVWVGSNELAAEGGYNVYEDAPNGIRTFGPYGAWKRIIDSGTEAFEWESIAWTGEAPQNTWMGVRVRTSDVRDSLSTARWIPESPQSDYFDLAGLDSKWNWNPGDFIDNGMYSPGDGTIFLYADGDSYVEYPADPMHESFPYISQIASGDHYIITTQVLDYDNDAETPGETGLMLKGTEGYNWYPPVALIDRQDWNKCNPDMGSISLWYAPPENTAPWQLLSQFETLCENPVLRFERRGDAIYAAYSEDQGETFHFFKEVLPAYAFENAEAGIYAVTQNNPDEVFTARFGPVVFDEYAESAEDLGLVPPGRYIEIEAGLGGKPKDHEITDYFELAQLNSKWDSVHINDDSAIGEAILDQQPGNLILQSNPGCSWLPGEDGQLAMPMVFQDLPNTDFEVYASILNWTFFHEPGDGVGILLWNGLTGTHACYFGVFRETFESGSVLSMAEFFNGSWNYSGYYPIQPGPGYGDCFIGMTRSTIGNEVHYSGWFSSGLESGSCYSIHTPAEDDYIRAINYGFTKIGLISGSSSNHFFQAAIGEFSFLPISGIPNPLSPILESVSVAGPERQASIFSSSISGIDIASEWSQSIEIPSFGSPGKYDFFADLISSTGERIDRTQQPIYITDTDLKIGIEAGDYYPSGNIAFGGAVQNMSGVSLTGLHLRVSIDGGIIHDETFDLDDGGIKNYHCSFSASEGSYLVHAEISAGSHSAFVDDKIQVTDTKVITEVSCPDKVGADPFETSVLIHNSGKLTERVKVYTELESASEYECDLKPGEKRIFSENHRIIRDGKYTVLVKVKDIIAYQYKKEIQYVEKMNIAIGWNSRTVLYPGQVSIPYTMVNDSPSSMVQTVRFDLAGPGDHEEIVRAVDLPQGGCLPGVVEYNLDAGEYILSWETGTTGGVFPFTVQRPFNISISQHLISESHQELKLATTINHDGIADFAGVLNFAGDVISESQNIIIEREGEKRFDLHLSSPGTPEGDHWVESVVTDNAGNVFARERIHYIIRGAEVALTGTPEDVRGEAGSALPFAFMVANSGMQPGWAEITVDAGDFLQDNRKVFVPAGQVQKVVFEAAIPPDTPSGDAYNLHYSFNGMDGDLTFAIDGIEFEYIVTLDKRSYFKGETAILNFHLEMPDSSLWAGRLRLRANYGSYSKEVWTTGPGTIDQKFEIPVTFESPKAFFGIYADTGRSLILGDLYLRQAFPDFSLTPDKDIYVPGEEVTAVIQSKQPGMMSIVGPGISKEFRIGLDHQIIEFKLPDHLAKGSYHLKYTMRGESRIAPIDVNGESVEVVHAEASANPRGYHSPGDFVTIHFSMIPHKTDELMIHLFIRPPLGEKSWIAREEISVKSGRMNRVSVDGQLESITAGTNEIYYEISSYGTLLTGGCLTVEIGPGKVVSANVRPHVIETGQEMVKADLELYGYGKGRLELKLNQIVLQTQPIELKGFGRKTFEIDTVGLIQGSHYIQANLFFEDCISSKADWFWVFDPSQNRDLPDANAIDLMKQFPENGECIDLEDFFKEYQPIEIVGIPEGYEPDWSIEGKSTISPSICFSTMTPAPPEPVPAMTPMGMIIACVVLSILIGFAVRRKP